MKVWTEERNIHRVCHSVGGVSAPAEEDKRRATHSAARREVYGAVGGASVGAAIGFEPVAAVGSGIAVAAVRLVLSEPRK